MDQLPALAVALPLLVAAILAGGSPLLPRRAADVLAIATAAAVMAACGWLAMKTSDSGMIEVSWLGGWKPRDGVAVGIAMVVDPLGAGLATLAATLATASLVFSWRYFEAVKGLYHALMLVFLAAMVGFCLTGDLFNLFVFFELMSVSAFALTGYKVEEQSFEGALNFAVVNSLGAFLILTGIALLYGKTGALNLAQIGRAIGEGPVDALPTVALVLIASGFLVKAACAPFHFWLADAHAVAPTPACVLFSGVMVELGLYAVARVEWSVFDGQRVPYGVALKSVMLGLGAITAVLGGVMCVVQRHIKRLLAFSTIGHVGMMLMGLGLGEVGGTAIYVLGHGCVKGALFLGAGILLHRRGTVDEPELKGRGRNLPLTGLMMVVGAYGLAGLEPFGTATGKGAIEATARASGHPWAIPVLVACSALTAGAVLRAAGTIFLGWGDPARERPDPGPEHRETDKGRGRTPGVMLAPVAALLVLGLAPAMVPSLGIAARLAAFRVADREPYARRVLEVPIGRVVPGAIGMDEPEPRSIGSELATLAATLVVAAVGLFGWKLPRPGRIAVGRVVGPALGVLRALHSGRVGDYVAWLVVGVAGLGAAMLVLTAGK